MWNKSTRHDIQDMFAELQQPPGLDRIFHEEGLTLRRDDGASPAKSAEYMKAYFQTPAGKAARKRYNDAHREERNAYSREYRARQRALRVGQRAADLDVVDCAAQ